MVGGVAGSRRSWVEIEKFDNESSEKAIDYSHHEHGYLIPDPRSLDSRRLKLQARHIRRQLDALEASAKVGYDLTLAFVTSSFTSGLFALLSGFFLPAGQQAIWAIGVILLLAAIFGGVALGNRKEFKDRKKAEYLRKVLADYEDEIEDRDNRGSM